MLISADDNGRHDEDEGSADSQRPPVENGDDQEVPVDKFAELLSHPDVRQFVKFCLVGASSTIVNLAVLNIIYKHEHQSLFTALAAGFFLSVLNGFFWNRRWTFKDKRGRSRQTQYLRFTLVNLVGFILDNTIVSAVLTFATPDAHHLGLGGHFVEIVRTILIPDAAKKQFSALLVNGAQLVAIAVVVFWNYFANKHWTFKH